MKDIHESIFYEVYNSMKWLPGFPGIPILLYHQVNDKDLFRHGYLTVVSIKSFEEQMKFLYENKYACLSLDETLAFLKANMIPKKCVCITFDDGYRDNYYNVFPVLRRYGFKATVFLISDYIGKGKWYSRNQRRWRDERVEGDFLYFEFLNREQINKMSKYGIDFGAHSNTHPDLTRIPVSLVREEIKKSKHIIEDILGKSVNYFAYPYGCSNDVVRQEVVKAEYKAACIIGSSREANKATADPFALGRIGIVPQYDLSSFKVMLSGGYRLYDKFARILKKIPAGEF